MMFRKFNPFALLSRAEWLAAFLLIWQGMSMTAPAHAQTPPESFKVAAGDPKQGSTYAKMFATLSGKCSTEDLTLDLVTSNGGVQNLELVTTNAVKGAMVPTSVLYAAKLDNPGKVAQLKTLFTLHNEEVHFIARSDTKQEGGVNLGITTLGGSKVTYNVIEDLKGRPVGAVGGSVVDAQILNSLLRLNLVVTPFESNAKLVAALTEGKIDAAVMVAGAPSDAVKQLPAGRFKLLAVRGTGETAAVYTPSKVAYSNLGQGKSVDTLATRALLVTRTFNSVKVRQQLGNLRECFYQNLDDIKDGDNVHPAWASVNAKERGLWDWYDLPRAEAPTAAEPAPVAKGKKK